MEETFKCFVNFQLNATVFSSEMVLELAKPYFSSKSPNATRWNYSEPKLFAASGNSLVFEIIGKVAAHKAPQ